MSLSFYISLHTSLALHLRDEAGLVESRAKSATKEPITQMLRKTSRGEETLLFAKNFLQHPMMLGSLIPCSRFLIGRLLGKVDWARARTIVDYRPRPGYHHLTHPLQNGP